MASLRKFLVRKTEQARCLAGWNIQPDELLVGAHQRSSDVGSSLLSSERVS
ncbi:hypothetical protein AAFM46_09620 [Arthrobacter sp. TMP15]|uniref:hypothetical protein n=1 Tax=Arthrobacter sp. TMP15 TaxID=3140789 RepID=UPI0031B9E280